MSDETELFLQTVQNMIHDVNQINSTNEKINRLKKYPELKPFLKLLMDPNQKTGLTYAKLLEYETKNSQLKKKNLIKEKISIDVLTLLRQLYTRTWTGNEAKNQVLHFMSRYPHHKDLIGKIIDKNLETRLDIKQINKAFPNLIVEFSVALANDFAKCETFFKKNQNRPWFISRKYDGVRCIVEVTPEQVQPYSRKGNLLPALKPLGDLIAQQKITTSFYLDGEICAIDDEGHENFTLAVSQARQKYQLMEKYRYYVFDMLTPDEFVNGQSESTLGERLLRVKTLVHNINRPECLREVEQDLYTPEKFQALQQLSLTHGWEGLMLRMSTTYKGKRSNEILKVKNFCNGEYLVKEIETGEMRTIDPVSGLEHTITTLKSVIIEHKGERVGVGSGFSLDDRQEFFQHPEKILGQIIAVKYFEESHDKNGKISLRFPTYKGLYGEDRDL